MKILSWNVNGIRAIAKKGFLDWFKVEKPEILCIQETKARPEQLSADILEPEGYHSFWNFPVKKGYAGVSVFSNVEPVQILDDFSFNDFDTEGRALVLDFKKFILLNVYFPNGRASHQRLEYKLEFYKKFLEYIDSLKNKNIIFCGDVNTAHKPIDLARPKQNQMYSGFLPEERLWLDKFEEHGFVDTFRVFCKEPGQYTWWDYKSRARERNVGWRIDYFYVSKKLVSKTKSSFILSDVPGSDHCPIGIEIN